VYHYIDFSNLENQIMENIYCSFHGLTFTLNANTILRHLPIERINRWESTLGALFGCLHARPHDHGSPFASFPPVTDLPPLRQPPARLRPEDKIAGRGRLIERAPRWQRELGGRAALVLDRNDASGWAQLGRRP
jgi:hypothetical protein